MLHTSRSKALVFFLCLGTAVAAQTTGTIAWKMALLKGEIFNPSVQDTTKPVEMKNGDKFQLFLQIVQSQAYVYVLFCGVDGTVAVLANNPLPEGNYTLLPSEQETYTITPPGGTELIYIVVTSSPQAKLDSLLSMKKRDKDAVINEVKRIQQSVSTIAEAPQKPVPIGGVFRGGKTSLQAAQFEGQSSYVKIIRIKH
jgi:hypothetical protein